MNFGITIQEKCACGGTLDLSGEFNYLSYAHERWTKRHAGCQGPKPVPPLRGEDANGDWTDAEMLARTCEQWMRDRIIHPEQVEWLIAKTARQIGVADPLAASHQCANKSTPIVTQVDRNG